MGPPTGPQAGSSGINNHASPIRRLTEQLVEKDQACVRSEDARRLAEQRAENYAHQVDQCGREREAMQKRLDELTQQLAAGTPLPTSSASSSTSQPSTTPQSGFAAPNAPSSRAVRVNQAQAPNQPYLQNQNQFGNGAFVHTVAIDIMSIPIFSGETRDVSVEAFLKAFRSFVQINNTPLHMYPAILDARTEGIASELVHQMTNAQSTDLAEIEKAFRREFKIGKSIAALEQAVSLTKQLHGEPVEDFYSRVYKAVIDLRRATPRHPGMSKEAWNDHWDSRKLRTFLGGLQQDIYIFVMTSNPETINKARAAAALAEQSLTRAHQHKCVDEASKWPKRESDQGLFQLGRRS
jgi:hypothetical protein